MNNKDPWMWLRSETAIGTGLNIYTEYKYYVYMKSYQWEIQQYFPLRYTA
jgi:hypothetical protein